MSGEHVHVEIPASVMLAAYAHAAETYPEECCGLMLGGPDGIGVDELRRCEWDKCGKTFVVKAAGRTAVRRFCSGTCRGRASEARTGKR